MNDIELTDKIIALGVGQAHSRNNAYSVYYLSGPHAVNAEHFVREWRVAGAMMELVEANSKTSDTSWAFGKALAWFRDGQISLPRAINEACVEAI